MVTKRILTYVFIVVSIGYLSYHYYFSGFGFGMMYHHYGYYDDYSSLQYFYRTSLSIAAYMILFVSLISLFRHSTLGSKHYLLVLNERLINGEISVEEYKKLKGVIDNNRNL